MRRTRWEISYTLTCRKWSPLRKQGTEIAEIESTKATSSVITPISGTVIEVNEKLADSPEIINEDPYGKGWVAIIEMDDVSELDELMDSGDYDKYIEEEAK